MTAPTVTTEKQDPHPVEDRSLSDAVIRFAGDSGDGMQLTGTQFTNTSALVGNDLSTTSYSPGALTEGVYYWNVTCTDDYNNSNTSNYNSTLTHFYLL